MPKWISKVSFTIIFLFTLIFLTGINTTSISAQSCNGIFDCCNAYDFYGNCTGWAGSVPCSGSTSLECTVTNVDLYCKANFGTPESDALNGCIWTVPATPTPPPPTPPPPTPVPTPIPSCSVSLTPIAPSTFIGTPVNFTAAVTVGSGSVSSVNFTSTNAAVSTVSPANDTTSPYNTAASALSTGSSTIRADVVMGGAVRCSATQVLTVSASSCTINFNSPNYTVDAGLTTTVSATGTPSGGTIDQYEFSVGSTVIATICTFASGPCGAGLGTVIGASSIIDLTGQTPGATNITATARMVDEGAQCSTIVPSNVTVNNPSAWWQVKEGDAVTDGLISSSAPPTAYNQSLIVNDVGEFPGVPTYQGSINPAPPNLSSTNWNANSPYSSAIPTFSFFESRVSSSVFTDVTTSTIDAATLTGGPVVNGYRWLRYDGAVYGNTLTIQDGSGIADISSNKVVLFVKDADLQVNSKINLIDGSGFFMAIVERDIIIGGSVGDAPVANPTPDLEGIYITDGEFNTGTSSLQLHVRGSVVGSGGVSMMLRILTDNSVYPSELFEYGVDQMLSFPPDLTPNRLIWREVAP